MLGQLIAIPIGVLSVVLLVTLWFVITPISAGAVIPSLPEIVISFVAIVVFHELVHAAVHPGAGRSSHSILGFWPSRAIFYAHYEGELSRNRFVAILLMPLLVISIFPLLLAAVSQMACGWAAFVSIFNAFLACADILGAGIVMLHVPASAIVRNQGWRTYWRPAEIAQPQA